MADEYNKEKSEQTGTLNVNEATKGNEPDLGGTTGTSGQVGTGHPRLPRKDADDRATIADDDDIATPIVPMKMDPSAVDDDSVAGHVKPEEHDSEAVRGSS